jgi:hypothetical protein
MKKDNALFILFIVVTTLCISNIEVHSQEVHVGASGDKKEIQLGKTSRSLLLDKDYSSHFTIAPCEPEFIEIK